LILRIRNKETLRFEFQIHNNELRTRYNDKRRFHGHKPHKRKRLGNSSQLRNDPKRVLLYQLVTGWITNCLF
jgi:hypothetical protein